MSSAMAQTYTDEMGRQQETEQTQQPSNGTSPADAYQKEMVELKALMQKSLEQRGLLAKIKAEIRAGIFETLEESDRASGPGEPKALVGTCSEQATALNGTKSGKLLGALICEYMEWAGVDHSLKLFLAETNLQSVFPTRRATLAQELGLRRPTAGRPLLLELLEQHYQNKAKEAQIPHPTTPTAAGSSSHGPSSAASSASSAISHARGMARASSPTRGPPPARSSSPFARGLSPFSRGEREKQQKSRVSSRDE